jgi:hypothetical protein
MKNLTNIPGEVADRTIRTGSILNQTHQVGSRYSGLSAVIHKGVSLNKPSQFCVFFFAAAQQKFLYFCYTTPFH